jgi:hypothetical protein
LLRRPSWKSVVTRRRPSSDSYDKADGTDLVQVATALDRKRQVAGPDVSQLSHNSPSKEQQPESDKPQDARIQWVADGRVAQTDRASDF